MPVRRYACSRSWAAGAKLAAVIHDLLLARDEELILEEEQVHPAWRKIDLPRYAGYGMMTSRGCPYPCTFCSVAPVWNLESHHRSARNIVAEMVELNHNANVQLFLF